MVPILKAKLSQSQKRLKWAKWQISSDNLKLVINFIKTLNDSLHLFFSWKFLLNKQRCPCLGILDLVYSHWRTHTETYTEEKSVCRSIHYVLDTKHQDTLEVGFTLNDWCQCTVVVRCATSKMNTWTTKLNNIWQKTSFLEKKLKISLDVSRAHFCLVK